MISKKIIVKGKVFTAEPHGKSSWKCKLVGALIIMPTLQDLKDAIRRQMTVVNRIDPILLNRLTNALKMMMTSTPIKLTLEGKKWCDDNGYISDGVYTINSIHANETLNIYNEYECICIEDISQEFIEL